MPYHRFISCGVALLVATLALAQPTSAQSTLEAQPGDGIWSLLRRAGVSPSDTNIDRFKELNEGRLIRSSQLVVGRSYEVPVNERIEPLFGPQYERVQIKSDALDGAVFYVVSGHGGPDPGSIGHYAGRDLPEDEIAYDVALRLSRRLIEEGATVYIIVQDPNDGIRDGTRFDIDRDEVYFGNKPIVLNQTRRLRDRASIINELYDRHRSTARLQRVISLHVDARGARHEPQIDVHFQVASNSGQQFGEVLHATFRDQYDRVQPGRGYNGTVEHRNLYLLRKTKPVAALVELGNIRHPRDQIRLTKANNRQALAEWLLKGLMRDYEGAAV